MTDGNIRVSLVVPRFCRASPRDILFDINGKFVIRAFNVRDFEEVALTYNITPKLRRRLHGDLESLRVTNATGDELPLRAVERDAQPETSPAPVEDQPINGHIYPRLDDHTTDEGDDTAMVSTSNGV